MKAWQRTIREKYEETEPHPIPKDLSLAIVRKITRKVAEEFILKYEWLGNVGTMTEAFGLFFADELAGVVCFGHPRGTVANICGKENADKVYWLARGACAHWAHPHSASYLINAACKAMSELGKFVFLATADTDAGEIGTVYQASNWLYLGSTAAPMMWKLPNQKSQEADSHDNAVKNYVRSRTGRATENEREPDGRLFFLVKGIKYYNGDVLPDGTTIGGSNRYPYKFKAGYGKTQKEAEAKREKELKDAGYEKYKGNPKHLYAGIYGDARLKRVLKKALTKEVLPYPKRIAGEL